MNALAGYTGFVGSSLYEKGQFDLVYNSKNIEKAYGTKPQLLVYAGLRAEKYLANHAPWKDMQQVIQAEENIAKIDPHRLVLISTIDVFSTPKNVDESSKIHTEHLHAYGYNRYQLELWVRQKYQDALIIRLPGLFGKNLKKNFIYDCMHEIPFMLKESVFYELAKKDPDIKKYYKPAEPGFYRACVPEEEEAFLKKKFRALGFSARNFTDSRSMFQFYSLARLWDDMCTALKAGLTLWHPATEPVSAAELFRYMTGREFQNELDGIPADYNYKTLYAHLFGGEGGYICKKEQVLEEIKRFAGQRWQ